MKLNGREKDIYDLVVSDIEKSDKPYSTLTNSEIAEQLKCSAFAVRDKVIKLHNKRALQRVCDFWDEDRKYHNRVLYKGRQTDSIE